MDFKNTIIVMTSNIASDFIQQLAERNAEQWEIDAKIGEALKATFRPEFLNRIDETVIFHSLTREDLRDIVQIQLRDLRDRLAQKRVTIELDDDAADLLCELGWDPAFGARPLKRFIQQKLENPLAQRVLSGEVTEGSHVAVTVAGKSFQFEVTEKGEGEFAGDTDTIKTADDEYVDAE